MSALLIAEHDNKEVKPFTLNAITAASQIDQDLHVLVIGKNVDAVSKSISEVPNVKKVIQIDNEIYENFLAENFAPVIVKEAENYSKEMSKNLLKAKDTFFKIKEDIFKRKDWDTKKKIKKYKNYMIYLCVIHYWIVLIM